MPPGSETMLTPIGSCLHIGALGNQLCNAAELVLQGRNPLDDLKLLRRRELDVQPQLQVGVVQADALVDLKFEICTSWAAIRSANTSAGFSTTFDANPTVAVSSPAVVGPSAAPLTVSWSDVFFCSFLW